MRIKRPSSWAKNNESKAEFYRDENCFSISTHFIVCDLSTCLCLYCTSGYLYPCRARQHLEVRFCIFCLCCFPEYCFLCSLKRTYPGWIGFVLFGFGPVVSPRTFFLNYRYHSPFINFTSFC